MTKRLALLAITLLSVAASPARAETASLEDYSWLIGVWTSKGTTPEGKDFTEEYAYEWTMNRKFMKTTYVMRTGETVAWTDVGMVAIDPATGTLFGFNFGMDGSIGWGRSIERPTPEDFTIEGNVVGPDLMPTFRFRMKRVGDDAIEVTLETKEGEAWVAQPPRTYTRKEKPEIGPAPELSEATPPDALAPLAPLVGVWRGTAEGGDAGAMEVSFEWRMNRNFLRRAEVVTAENGSVRETVEWIGWDPQQKTIVDFSFGAGGETARAAATFTDGLLTVGPAEDSRATYRLDEEGHLVVSLKGGTLVATLAPGPPRK